MFSCLKCKIFIVLLEESAVTKRPVRITWTDRPVNVVVPERTK